MKNEKIVREMMFDFFDDNLFGGLGFTAEEEDKVAEPVESVEVSADDTEEAEAGGDAYLKKGEKILSLAKQAFARLATSVYGKMEEKLLNMKLLKAPRWWHNSEVSAQIVESAASIAKAVFKELKFDDDGDLNYNCDAYKTLQKMMPKGISITLSNYHVYRRDMGDNDRYLEAVFEDAQGTLAHVTGKQIGSLDLHRDGSRHWRRDGLSIVSLHRWVGILFCIKIAEERLMELRELSLDEVENSAEYSALMDFIEKRKVKGINSPYTCIFENGFRPHKKGEEPGPVENIVYSEGQRKRGLKAIMEDILYSFGCPLELKEYRDGEENYTSLVIGDGAIRALGELWPYWYLTDATIDYSFERFHKLLFDTVGNYLSSCSVIEPFMAIIKAMRDRYAAEKLQRKLMRELSGDYARSYQTKKNIPKKTIKAMKESAFNDYFSYVEFDEDVDLDLVKDLFKEFKAVMTTFLNGVSCSGNAIRFRKLGNHKASGLYYPQVKCLCVDLRIPSSFIHELGHLIDYCRGELSLKSSFDEVRRIYENRLRKASEEEGNEVLKGKTKYNLDYYLTPTEIFARCFEIYLAFIKGVDNSILPKAGVSGFAYPVDDEMMGAIKSFYDSLDLNGTGELPFEITGATIPTVEDARSLKGDLLLVNGARCASWWAQDPEKNDALITCARVGIYGVVNVIPHSGHRYYIRPLLTFRSTEPIKEGTTFKVGRSRFTVISPGRAIAERSIATSEYAEPYKRYDESIVRCFVDEWYRHEIEDKKTGAIFTSYMPDESEAVIKAAGK